MSEEKFSKCEKGEKCFKCRISGVREKKKKLKEKFRREKKKWVEILLSSCSLVGLFMLILQVKVTEKKWKFSKYFSVKYLKLKIFVAGKKVKVKKMFGSWVTLLVGR